MRRATITIPDDLEAKVERFRTTQPARPSLTSVVQTALEDFLVRGESAIGRDITIADVLRHRSDIRRIVSDHGGSNPRLFGSLARGESGEMSDIDILIDLSPGRTLFDLATIRVELEELLNAPVDVVTTSALEGDVQDEILSDALAL